MYIKVRTVRWSSKRGGNGGGLESAITMSVCCYILRKLFFFSCFTVQHKNKAFQIKKEHGYPCYKGNTNKLYKSSIWPNVLQWLKRYGGQTTTLIKRNENKQPISYYAMDVGG